MKPHCEGLLIAAAALDALTLGVSITALVVLVVLWARL
jgi:hypothetical protein